MSVSRLPLVYSCSGCSNVAQMANHIALQLHRRGLAQMGCVAGLGADLPGHLKLAGAGRPIIGLDGCSQECVRRTLERHELSPLFHWILTQFGGQKRAGAEFDPTKAEAALERITTWIENLAPTPDSPPGS